MVRDVALDPAFLGQLLAIGGARSHPASATGSTRRVSVEPDPLHDLASFGAPLPAYVRRSSR